MAGLFEKKAFKKSKYIKGFGRKRKEFQPRFGLRAKRDVRLQEEVEVRLLRQLGGDEKLVKRIMALMEEFPAGTIPEFICYEWLERNHIKFSYQAMLFGGRRMSGGLVPDFVIQAGGGLAVAWQVQGEYWHSLARKGGYDRNVTMRMEGTYFQGRRIWKVAQVWEGDLLDKYQRETVLNLALQGVSVRTA